MFDVRCTTFEGADGVVCSCSDRITSMDRVVSVVHMHVKLFLSG